MQSDASTVTAYPPVGYGVLWLIMACAGIVLLFLWYGFVFWVTRRKHQRTLATLKPLAPPPLDIPAIQAKYFGLISEVEQAYTRGEIKSRAVHQKLSILLRFFAQEAHGIRAYSLTLSDLRKTRYTQLTAAIDAYYRPEFDAVLVGDVSAALTTAREVVGTWS